MGKQLTSRCRLRYLAGKGLDGMGGIVELLIISAERRRSFENSVPVEIKIMCPQDDVLDLRV